jgi:hypothetical protein
MVTATPERFRVAILCVNAVVAYLLSRVSEYLFIAPISGFVDLMIVLTGWVSGLLLMVVIPLLILAVVELVFGVDVVDWDSA